MTKSFDHFCSRFLSESLDSWSPERFMRVVPRDLFNEAKMLSMVSKFAKDVNQGKMPGGFIGKLNKKWTVALSENGELYISGFDLTYKGQKTDLTMNYNAGKVYRFPLQITVENMDLWSVSIYDENGELDSDMKQFEEAHSPGKIDIPDWSSTIEELKRLGRIGLNDNSGLTPKDDSRGFADSFSNGKIGNIKINNNINENFDKFCSHFLFESVNDDEYLRLAKEPEKNKNILQQMINKAAKKVGYSIGPVYRGDVNHEINIFDPNKGKNRLMNKHPKAIAFFTSSQKKALQHGQIRRFFLKMENPNTIDGSKIEVGKIGVEPGIYLTDGKIDQLINSGHDGNIFLNAYDYSAGLHTEYVVFSSHQIKSADPVTYDDNGNVIPLSQRFDSSKDDIRY
jgi:hypothetical protein